MAENQSTVENAKEKLDRWLKDGITTPGGKLSSLLNCGPLKARRQLRTVIKSRLGHEPPLTILTEDFGFCLEVQQRLAQRHTFNAQQFSQLSF